MKRYLQNQLTLVDSIDELFDGDDSFAERLRIIISDVAARAAREGYPEVVSLAWADGPYAAPHQTRKIIAAAIDAVQKRGGATTVQETANLLGVSESKVYALCKSGELDCTKVGRRVTVTQEALARLRERPAKTKARYRHL
jgi:excisionase family DNA binding protein